MKGLLLKTINFHMTLLLLVRNYLDGESALNESHGKPNYKVNHFCW